jgi:hypothetical protein
MLCKICPTCNHKNSQNELICKSCLTPIDGIDIIECDKKETVKEYVEFVFDTGILKLYHHDLVGREHKGKELLKENLTVSREHIELIKESNDFFIVDKSSTNKTYLNGEEITPKKKIKIKNGDEISLSAKVKCKVKL